MSSVFDYLVFRYNGCTDSRVSMPIKRHRTKMTLVRRNTPNGIKKGGVTQFSGPAKEAAVSFRYVLGSLLLTVLVQRRWSIINMATLFCVFPDFSYFRLFKTLLDIPFAMHMARIRRFWWNTYTILRKTCSR